MRAAWLLAGMLLGSAGASAQSAPAPGPPDSQPLQTAPTIRVQAHVVAVTARVRDKAGNLVTTLSKDNFQVREDGKLQTLRYFDADNNLPLTLGLMVDTSGSLRQYLPEEEAGAALFVKSMLTRPEDRAFLERFDSRATLLQPMTSHADDLNKALPGLSTPDPYMHTAAGGTLLFDAVCSTVRQVVGKEEGRRALILLTDGEDNGSQNTVREAIQLAEATDVGVYVILFSSSDSFYGERTGHTGRELMDRLTHETGGELFAARGGKDVQRAFAAIEHDLRSQYRLGYTPPESPPFSYHGLQVEVNQPGLTVQARGGYYTPRTLKSSQVSAPPQPAPE